ncbi:MAG: type II CAAX endopeptidase family protein [Phycisphaerales bacterium]|jgi:membrane protease YdiL (CAAX protease family)|nr:type II CAAX endopeptidase family protein [Phycisphaerales bacterium]
MQTGSQPPPKPIRTFPVVAWAAIVVLAAMLMLAASAGKAGEAAEGGTDALLEIEARLVLAQEALAPGTGGTALQAALDHSSPDRRLRLAAVAAALGGPSEGRSVVASVQQDLAEAGAEPTAEELTAMEDLDRLFAGDESGDLQARVEASLGWFGRLAVAASPADPQAREARVAPAFEGAAAMMVGLTMVVLGLGGLGVFGLVMLVLGAVRAFGDGLPVRITLSSGHDGVYAETFAVWLVLFQVIVVAAGAAAMNLPASWTMLLTFAAFFVSLAALGWPVLRGVAWSRVRQDIGWTCGQGMVKELGCGLLGYAAAIPIAGVGMGISMILILLAAPDEGAGAAAHPIVNELAAGGWPVRIQVLLVASVAAPVVEETMFRGVLYRQIRSATATSRLWMSVAVSAGLTSLVFAVIHPQGVLAVPALMGLAIAFSLAREWRGSLIAPIVMHGVSNGIVMAMLMVMLG